MKKTYHRKSETEELCETGKGTGNRAAQIGNGIRAVGLGTRGTKQSNAEIRKAETDLEIGVFCGFSFSFSFFFLGVDRIWVIIKPDLIISDKTHLIIFTHDIL